MEATAKQHERENNNTSPTNSPNSNGSSTSPNNCINIINNSNNNSNTNSNTNNSGVGGFGGGGGMGGVLQNQTPPQTPKPITRSDQTNPYPTTFVQADTSTFKQVVQMLTGSPSSESSSSKSNKPEKSSIPPIKNSPKKQQSFKLYERRNQLKNNLMINTLVQGGINNICRNNNNNGFSSPRHQPEILSPSMLDFPKLVLSPVTPLNDDPFNHNNKMMMNKNHSFSSLSSPLSKTGSSSSEEEDKAIAEKGFFLHPSPRNPSTPRDSEPQLLPLFPLTSPRVSASST